MVRRVKPLRVTCRRVMVTIVRHQCRVGHRLQASADLFRSRRVATGVTMRSIRLWQQRRVIRVQAARALRRFLVRRSLRAMAPWMVLPVLKAPKAMVMSGAKVAR